MGWLEQQVPAREIPRADLVAGRIAGPLAELLALPRRDPLAATGAQEAAELLLGLVAEG